MSNDKKLTTEITSKILITLYKGHLPIAWGHLDPENGKTWLGVSVAEGYTHQGNGTRIVSGACDFADKGGWDLHLTCNQELDKWYKKFGFVRNGDYMKRKARNE